MAHPDHAHPCSKPVRFQAKGKDAENLERWHTLTREWHEARQALVDARAEMDIAVVAHLEGHQPAPCCSILHAVDDLVYREAETRGALDEMIQGLGG